MKTVIFIGTRIKKGSSTVVKIQAIGQEAMDKLNRIRENTEEQLNDLDTRLKLGVGEGY